jgi:hypothetical protein
MAVVVDADNGQTIIVSWVFTWLAIFVMAIRLVMRKLRRQKFELGDYITMAAIFCLIVQNILVHMTLVLGTTVGHVFDSNIRNELPQRKVGAVCAVISRVFLIT